MKRNNLIFLFVFLILTACNSDDNTSSTDNPVVTLDVDSVIALPPNSDITNLVSFNGQNAATFTSELDLGDGLLVGRPDGLAPDDVFVYSTIIVSRDINGTLVEVNFDEINFISDDTNLQFVIPPGQPSNYFDLLEVEVFELRAIGNEMNDVDYKYDLEVFITRSGIEYGPYFIDPKIRIKS